jgi:hypothetical protein
MSGFVYLICLFVYVPSCSHHVSVGCLQCNHQVLVAHSCIAVTNVGLCLPHLSVCLHSVTFTPRVVYIVITGLWSN